METLDQRQTLSEIARNFFIYLKFFNNFLTLDNNIYSMLKK